MHHRPFLFLTLLSCGLTVACGSGHTTQSGDTGSGSQPAAGGGNSTTTDGTGGGGSQNTNQLIPATGDANQVAGSPNAAAATAIALAGGPNNAYTLVGRFDATVPTALRFSLPNSKIGVQFSGSGNAALLLSGDGTDLVGVTVDGGADVVVITSPNAVAIPYPVATGLAPGTHTLWLTKLTESYETSQSDANVRTGQLTFGGLQLDAGAQVLGPPAPKGRLIAFLGDSSTTGYGVGQLQSGNSTCTYTPQTQDANLSVPGQLAALFDAEVINVSASGKGVVQSAYDLNNTDQLPSLWQKAVPPAASPNYTFPALAVGAVFISAGSDDLVGAYGSGTITNEALFVSTYVALLAEMRGHYPQALLVGIVNPNAIDTDKSTLTRLIDQAVSQRNAAGDANVMAYDYFAGDANNWQSYNDADAALGLGHGCQGHASPKGSLFLATRLAAAVRAKLGW